MKQNRKNHGIPRYFIGFSRVIAVVIAVLILIVWIVRFHPNRTGAVNKPGVGAVESPKSSDEQNGPASRTRSFAEIPPPEIPDQPVYYSTTMRNAPVGYEIKTWNRKREKGRSENAEIGAPPESSPESPSESPSESLESLEIVCQSCLKLRRAGQTTVLRMTEKQTMTRLGATPVGCQRWKIESYETTLQAGGQTQRVYGVIDKNQLKIYEKDQLAQTTTITENFHGIMYLDHLYLEGRLPLPGQTIEIQAVVGSVAADLIVRSDEAAISTNPDSPRFNRITVFSKNQEGANGAASTRSWPPVSPVPLEVVWNGGRWPYAILELPGLQARNEPVDILPSGRQALSAEQYPARFEAIPENQLFDLNAAMLIPATEPVNSQAGQNRYVVELPPNVLPSDAFQTVEPIAEQPNRCRVTVSLSTENASKSDRSSPPDSAALLSSPLVNFQDSRIQKLLNQSATGESATGESATGESATGESATGESATGESRAGESATGEFPAEPIQSVEQLKVAERFVADYIKDKTYCDALADAGSVVETRRGDCTEHACLLAALLRGRNVPCRMVIGLVYVSPSQSFGFHVWNEAWLAAPRRWIPLDAAQRGFSSAHLKFTVTNFDGASLNSAMTSLYNNMDKIKTIKVLSNH